MTRATRILPWLTQVTNNRCKLLHRTTHHAATLHTAHCSAHGGEWRDMTIDTLSSSLRQPMLAIESSNHHQHHPHHIGTHNSDDDHVRRKFLSVLGIEQPVSKLSVQTATTTDVTRSEFSDVATVAIKKTIGTATVGAAAAVPAVVPAPAVAHHGFDSKEWMHPRTHNLALSQEPLKYNRYDDVAAVASASCNSSPPKRRKTAAATNEDDSSSSPSSASTAATIGTNGRTKKHRVGTRTKIAFNEMVAVVPIPMRTEYSNRVRSRLWSNALEIQENAMRNTIEFAHEGWDWRRVTLDEGMIVCCATGERIHPVHYEPNAMIYDAIAPVAAVADGSGLNHGP